MPSTEPDHDRSDYTDFELAIAEVLDRLGEGDIMTYGEVAAEAGRPGAARAVGSFMRNRSGFPWWRIVAANGRLVPGLEREHAQRLAAEGVTVENGRIPMR